MKQFFENEMDDIISRNDFQESLDFFYDRYMDFFPTGKLGS